MRRLLALCVLSLLALPALAEKWALLIGIDQYEDRNRIAALSGAARDARKFKATLTEIVGVPDANIELLVSDGDTKPTRFNIVEALDKLQSNAKAGDTVFVYFSGHGTQLDGKDYLLPFDFNGRSAFTGKETGLAEERFYEQLSKVQARAIVLIWDKCRNDPFTNSRDATGPKRNTMKLSQAEKSWSVVRDTRVDAMPILVKLFACAPGQCSYEWTDKGQGYFTYYLEQGLRGAAADGKGKITVKSLKDYVRQQVTAQVKRNENADQNPHVALEGTDPEDFVIAQGKPGKAVAAEKKPSPRPAPTPNPSAETLDLAAKLIVRPSVAGASVTVDKKQLAGLSFEVELDDAETRTFEVVVKAPGYKSSAAKVTLTRGKSFTHTVTLTKAPVAEPAAPTPPAPDSTEKKPTETLAARVLKAHGWDAFRKLKSLQLSGACTTAVGSSTMSSPDIKVTLTPQGKFHVGWRDEAGTNAVWGGNTSVEMHYQVNGTETITPPGLKLLVHPLATFLGNMDTLSKSPEKWIASSDGDSLTYTEIEQGIVSKVIFFIDTKTNNIRNFEISQPGITITIRISRYETINGVLAPTAVQLETTLNNLKWSASHTYTRVKTNVAVPGEIQ